MTVKDDCDNTTRKRCMESAVMMVVGDGKAQRDDSECCANGR